MKPVDFALSYAAAGVPVFPVAPGGKAPLTRHGFKDASTNPDAVRAWWGMWPDARIGADLEAAGIVDVSSDSAEWLDTFERRGLPADAPRYQSAGGDGHVHVLTRRPDGCPHTRICRSGEYDVLSAGYAILPNADAAAGGVYGWLTPPERVNLNGGLPDAPAWVVTMLREHAANRGRRTEVPAEHQAAGAGDDGDEPPILLSADALAVWRGERFKAKPDGDVDRSASLLWIGRVLYDAGLTRRGLVSELRARDEALGWRKYADRPDADARYHELVDELETSGRSARAETGHGAPLAGHHERAAAMLAAAQDVLALLAAIRRNPAAKHCAGTGIALALEVRAATMAGRLNDDGSVTVWVRDVLAPAAGVSRETAGRYLKVFQEGGLLVKRKRFVPGLVVDGDGVIDDDAPVVRGLTVRLFGGWRRFLEALATFAPPRRAREHRHCHPAVRDCDRPCCADGTPPADGRAEPDVKGYHIEDPPQTVKTAVDTIVRQPFTSGSTAAGSHCCAQCGAPTLIGPFCGVHDPDLSGRLGIAPPRRDPTDDETAARVRSCGWCGERTVGHELCAECDPPGNSRIRTSGLMWGDGRESAKEDAPPSPGDDAPPPEPAPPPSDAPPPRPLCAECGKRPTVPYHARCQPCIVGSLPATNGP